MASRNVELPEIGSEETRLELPDMMFADGEEPVGVRVLTYQSSRAINNILDALHEDEIQFIRSSSFGKLVDIAEKPAFSGRFGRFLLSRQLKIERKHEAWFRFAGKPIRFSLREFSIVTGLPCGEVPVKPKSKKKRTIRDKPYWPELFGTVEDMSVSRAIKMLRKNSVTDKGVRIKLACLAIVSSVLLSTNLKMKMLKEHAELLGDIKEFLAFPWGRLAFDMLMSSIKKRDEVSLSQDTIALQGFALALQLVIVEAVPSLTEVFQETCSSSESDSDDEDCDFMTRTIKKKTLSPAHAREVDKRGEVLVRSIIPEDPSRPVDESVLVWSDEVVDVKVDNLLKLISLNHVFSKEMFRGGATKLDVHRLREKPRTQSRKKASTHRSKESTTSNDETTIINIVSSILKPELDRVDGSVAAALASVQAVSSSAQSYQASVVSTVEKMLKAFKEEIMTSVQNVNHNPVVEREHTSAPRDTRGKSSTPANPPVCALDANDQILSNVMENISHYSTPPGSPDRNPDSDGQNRSRLPEVNGSIRMEDENNGLPTFSAQSQTNDKHDAEGFPSFDLGLSQDAPPRVAAADDEIGDNGEENCLDNINKPVASRKSKRLKLVLTPLLNEYQCDTAILNRAREAKMGGSNYYEFSVIEEKFAKLTTLLQRPCVINVAGLSVTGNDISDIAARSRPLPGKVFDILMRLVRSTFYNQVGGKDDKRTEFLDSRFVSLLSRHYDRFKNSKLKDTYAFPKGLVDCVVKSCSSGNAATRFYLPLHVEKKHWIGLCVDFTASKIYILDCNSGVRSDSQLTHDLLPISDMFPFLLKHCGLLDSPATTPLSIDRIKGVAQNSNSADSALTAALLIQTHALFGPDTCRCLTPAVIADEAHRAAVMLYEFHAKL